jgi:vancomycin permeability regulator SanA
MTARIIALFAGLLALLNLGANLLWPGFDASSWWIGLGALPTWAAQPLLGLFGLTMVAFAFRQPSRARRFFFTTTVAVVFAGIAAANAAVFYRLVASGRIAAGFPVPLSLAVFAGMVVVAREAWRQGEAHYDWRRVAGGGGLLLAAFPLALMLFFGNTDYRRPADVAVVFGARVYASGKLSDALEDRIRTACDLYHAGLVRKLALSGGRGDGAVTEAAAMRRYAVSHGVSAGDIFIDDSGSNTEATVRDTVPLFRQWGARRVLAVSHFYHLPRVKLAYQRAGIDVFTVPARQGRLLGQIPFNMAREVAAFWEYYFKQKPSDVSHKFLLNLIRHVQFNGFHLFRLSV